MLVLRVGRAALPLAYLLLLQISGEADLAGEYALALAISGPLFVLGDFSMRTIYQTTPLLNYSRAMHVQLAGLASASIGTLTIASFTAVPLHITTLVVTIKVTEYLNDLSVGVSLRDGEIKTTTAILLSGYVTALLAVVLLGTASKYTAGLGGYAAALLFVTVITVFNTRRTVRSSSSITQRPTIARIATRGLLSAAASAAASLFFYTPQYILSWERGAEALGQVAIVIYVFTGMELVSNAPLTAQIERLRRARSQSKAEFWSVAARLVLRVEVGVIAASLLAVALLSSFSINAPEASPMVLPLLLGAGAIPVAHLLGYLFSIEEMELRKLLSYIFAVALYVPIAWILVALGGAYGAVLSIALSYYLRSAASVVLLVRMA